MNQKQVEQMNNEKIKQTLIDFEKRIAEIYERGEIPYLTHFSGGNEEQLIEIFKEVKKGDYVFSTHRSHYHYLLAGGSAQDLEEKIRNGQSMFVFNRELNFFCSSIVAGTPTIAAGVAYALKRKKSGAEDEGHFYEAVRYVDGWDLPCTFVIEDNDLSVDTTKEERRGNGEMNWPDCVRKYCYTRTYPHAGTGKWVDFTKGEKQK